MDLSLPEDVRMFGDTVRRFVQRELDPIAEQVEETGEIPESVRA